MGAQHPRPLRVGRGVQESLERPEGLGVRLGSAEEPQGSGAYRDQSAEQPADVHLHIAGRDGATGFLLALLLCMPAVVMHLPVRLTGPASRKSTSAAAGAPGEGPRGRPGPCHRLSPWTFVALLPLRVDVARVLLREDSPCGPLFLPRLRGAPSRLVRFSAVAG